MVFVEIHPAPLDTTVLAELASAVGGDFVPDLLQAFIDDLARLRVNAGNAVAQGDLASFHAVLHSLRGASAYFGATDLTKLLARYRQEPPNSPADLQAAWIGLEPVMLTTSEAAAVALTADYGDTE